MDLDKRFQPMYDERELSILCLFSVITGVALGVCLGAAVAWQRGYNTARESDLKSHGFVEVAPDHWVLRRETSKAE